MINWLKQREQKTGPLEFGVDVNAARYKDHVRETPNGDVSPSCQHLGRVINNLQSSVLRLTESDVMRRQVLRRTSITAQDAE